MNPALRRLIGVMLSLVFFVSSVAVFSFLIVPASHELQDLRGERNALKELLDRETSRIKAVSALFEQYGGVSDLQRTLGMALPTEEEVPDIINQLQGVAKVSGVLINSLSINLPAIKAGDKKDVIQPVGVVQVTLALEGDYGQIKSYLGAIETNVRIMDVQRLGVQGGTESNTLSYNIVVNAYYQL